MLKELEAEKSKYEAMEVKYKNEMMEINNNFQQYVEKYKMICKKVEDSIGVRLVKVDWEDNWRLKVLLYSYSTNINTRKILYFICID